MTTGRAAGVVFAAVLAAVQPAAAQSVATSLAALQASGRLRPGDTIYVTDATGRTIGGALANLTADAVTLDTGMLGDSRRTVAGTTIERIERADGLTNGVLIGAVAGGAAAALMPTMLCDLPDPECSVRAFLFAGVPIAVGAVVAGALIDHAHRPTVFQHAGRTSHLQIAPFLGPSRSGLAVSLRF